MPDGQNIIDLGYDVDKLTAQQKVVVACLNEVFQLSENLDGRKIAPDITGIQDLNKANATSKKAMDDIGLAVKEYNKILSEMATTQAKQNAATSTAAESLAKEKAILQATNAELKANAQLQNAAAGSIEEAVAKVKALTLERNKLNLTTDEGKKRQEEINLEIDKNNVFIQNNVSGLEKQKINVGNYSSILSGYANTLRGLRGPTKLLAEAFGMSTMEADQFRLVVEHTLQGLASYFKGSSKAAQSTVFFANATEAAVTTTDNFTASTTNATIVSTSLTTELEANAVAQEGQASATEVATVAFEAEAVAATEATVATGGLLTLLLPFLAVVAIAAAPIYLLVDAFKTWINADKNAMEAEKNLAESLEKSIALEKEAVETIKAKNDAQLKGAKDELALAAKAGASKDELLEKEKKIAQQELENAKKIKDSRGINSESVAKAFKDEQHALLEHTGIQNRINEATRIEGLISTMSFIEKNLFLKRNGYVIENQDKLKAELEAADSSHKTAKTNYDFQKGILDDFTKAQQTAAEKGIEIYRHETEEENKLTLQRLTDREEITKAKNAIILADDKSTLSQKLAALKGNNEAEKKVLEEGLRQKLTAPGARGSDGNYTKETLAEIEKVNTAKAVLNIKYLDDERKLNLSFHARDLEALKVYNETLLNETIESNKRIIASDVFSLEERTTALSNNSKLQSEIINKEYQRQLELKGFVGERLKHLEKTEKDELAAIEVEHNTKIRNLALEQENELITIQLSELDKLKKDAENYYKDSEKDAELANAEITSNTTRNYASQKMLLNDKLISGQISISNYHKEVKKLEESAAQESLRDAQLLLGKQADIEQERLDTAKKLRDKMKGNKELMEMNPAMTDSDKIALDKLTTQLNAQENLIKDSEKKIFDIKAQYAKNGVKLSDDEANKIIATKDKIKDSTKQLVNESINLIKTLVDSGYENELNALKKVKEQTDENYAIQNKNIENSSLNEEQKSQEKAQLQAQQRARDKQLEREQREIKNRQAKADRAFAVAGIIESTGLAVANALASSPPPLNFILAGLVGTLGAFQLATVLSKPIPQYAEGTKNHPGGPAIVGEGKYKENVTLPSGESFIADKPMLLNLPMGTAVEPITHEDIDMLMSSAMFGKKSKMFLLAEQRENRQIDKLEAVMKENNLLLKKISEKDARIKSINNVNIDLGWTNYINQQVYGK